MDSKMWESKIPKTLLSWVFAWTLVTATAVRYFITGEAPDGGWLAFLAGVLGYAATVQVGSRAATKADVIMAEAAVAKDEATKAPVTDITLGQLSEKPPEATEDVPLEDIP